MNTELSLLLAICILVLLDIFCISKLLEWCPAGECWLRGAVQVIKVGEETKKYLAEDFSELGCQTSFSARIDAVKIEEDFSSDLSESEEKGWGERCPINFS